MLFRRLKINYFGRFKHKEIELKPGINLICGENEAGKSTMHTFIKGMLFGIERMRGRGASSKEDQYTRYLPWDYPGAYSGSMDIEIEGRQYRLERSFHANDKSFSVTDLLTGREVKLKEGLINELIPGLSETTYKNTISIEQLKAHTDTELAAQVRNFIANLSVARSKEINVSKAISFLTEQKKQLESTQNPAALAALQADIEAGMAREEKMDQLTLQLKEWMEQEKQLLKQRKELSAIADNEETKRMEQLPAILEKYHSYEELHNQVVQINHQIDELKNKTPEGGSLQHALDQLKEDRRIADALRNNLYELEKQEQKLMQDIDVVHKRGRKALFYGLTPGVAIAFLIAFLSGFQFLGLILAAACLILGGAYTLIFIKRNHTILSELTNRKAVLQQKSIEEQNEVIDILTRHQASTLEALGERQEELLRSSLTIEHGQEQKKELEERKSKVQDSMDAIYDTIMTYLQYFMCVEELTPQAMERITEELRLKKQESMDRLVKLNESYETCRLQIEKLRWDISSLEENEAELQNNRRRYEQQKDQQAQSAVELEAIKLALSSIGELSTQIHDSFGHKLNLAVSEVIGEVTGHKYYDLKVDEKLDVKVGWNGSYVLLERLSAGTIDQVYFALRLAVADLLLGKNEVPLLFDDSFALYDDNRVRAAITEIAKRKQSILFTCHKREQKLLEELGIPYHLVTLS
jgi:uncharacterized protein YhaN